MSWLQQGQKWLDNIPKMDADEVRMCIEVLIDQHLTKDEVRILTDHCLSIERGECPDFIIMKKARSAARKGEG